MAVNIIMSQPHNTLLQACTAAMGSKPAAGRLMDRLAGKSPRLMWAVVAVVLCYWSVLTISSLGRSRVLLHQEVVITASRGQQNAFDATLAAVSARSIPSVRAEQSKQLPRIGNVSLDVWDRLPQLSCSGEQPAGQSAGAAAAPQTTAAAQAGSASSSRSPVCQQQQKDLLQAALQPAVSQPSLWQTWDTTLHPPTPLYGSWSLGLGGLLDAFKAALAASGHQAAPIKGDGKQWVVITSIAPPTPQVEAWTALEGWNVVVVADKKTPTNWTHPAATLLSMATQQQLPLATARLMPHGNYARKMLGYLYAIAQGAELVYETDDDNAPKPSMQLNWIKPERTHDVAWTQDEGTAVNPYAHFGQCDIWPRGYPLQPMLQHGLDFCHPARLSQVEAVAHVPIQQGLADLDPDVDAIWRLTNPHRIGAVKFDAAQTPLAYSKRSFSPYNTQNTLHYRSAFWALFIPAAVNMRVCDIWRSYWAQRLLWEMDANLLFVSGTVDQVRNPHSYVRDFKDELQMYVQADSLVEFLDTWQCHRSHMYDCMLQLGHDMSVAGYWPASDVELLTAWVSDLAGLGYQPPKLAAAHKHDTPEGWLAQAMQHLPLETYKERVGLHMKSRTSCALQDLKASAYKDHLTGSTIHLSIVLAVQNSVDANGQHFRISTFLRQIANNVKAFPELKQLLELVVVDFGSDMSVPGIHALESITWPDLAHMPAVRIVRVPNSVVKVINQKMAAPVAADYWEFAAKNIGIRRACGEFVLITNPDAYLTTGFWSQVTHRPFDAAHYYRMGRIEIMQSLPPESVNWDLAAVEEGLWQKRGGMLSGMSVPPVTYYRNNQVDDTYRSAPVAPPFSKTDYPPGQLVFDAPGDFTLMSREAWFAIRGYPEVPIPTRLDDVAVAAAASIGLQAATPAAPAMLYHLHHTKEYGGASRLSWKHTEMLWGAWMKEVVDNLWAGKHMPYNKEDFGFNGVYLPEVLM